MSFAISQAMYLRKAKCPGLVLLTSEGSSNACMGHIALTLYIRKEEDKDQESLRSSTTLDP